MPIPQQEAEIELLYSEEIDTDNRVQPENEGKTIQAKASFQSVDSQKNSEAKIARLME